MRRPPLPELALFGLTIAWGASFVLVPWAERDCGMMTLVALRMGIGLAVLTVIRPTWFRATALEWRAGVLGGLLLAMGYVLQTAGLYLEAGPGKSGFLTAFYVTLVPLFESVVYRCLPPARDLVALAVAAAGIGLIVLREDLTLSSAEVLVALSALAWAAQIVVVGRVAERVDAMRLSAIQLLVLTAVGLAGVPAEPTVHWTGLLVGSVVFLGVVTNALGFVLQAWAQRTVPPTRTAVIFSPEPVFAALFGVWLAGEAFGLRQIEGAVLVGIAVALSVVRPTKDAAAVQGGS